MIYFIKTADRGFVKIGQARDPEARLKQLQTASPDELEIIATIPDYYGDTEKELHARFKDDRYRGEWFRYSREIRQYLVESRCILDGEDDIEFYCMNEHCKLKSKMQNVISGRRFAKMLDYLWCKECDSILIPNFYFGNLSQFEDAPYCMSVHVNSIEKKYDQYHASRINRNVKWLYQQETISI